MSTLLTAERVKQQKQKQDQLISCQQLVTKMKKIVDNQEDVYGGIGYHNVQCDAFKQYCNKINNKSNDSLIHIVVEDEISVNQIRTTIDIDSNKVTYRLSHFDLRMV